MAKAKYEIYLSSYNGTSVKLPILPAELPEISVSSDIEDFTAVKGGHYSIIGLHQQPTISVDHMVPKKGKSLSFSASTTTGTKIIKILKSAMKNRAPVRYTIAKKSGGYYVNRLFAVSSYSYHIDRKMDYHISFELTGWKKYTGWKSGAGQAAKVAISPSKVTIKKGKKKTAKLKNVASSAKITWTSSDTSVVTVTSKGVMTGKGKGKATVTATYKKKDYTCEVAVK